MIAHPEALGICVWIRGGGECKQGDEAIFAEYICWCRGRCGGTDRSVPQLVRMVEHECTLLASYMKRGFSGMDPEAYTKPLVPHRSLYAPLLGAKECGGDARTARTHPWWRYALGSLCPIKYSIVQMLPMAP